MEELLTQIIVEAATKFPKIMTAWIAFCGLYTFMCFMASLTKSPTDDEVLGRLKRFFSLPVKNPKPQSLNEQSK